MNRHSVCGQCHQVDGVHSPTCPVAAVLRRREALGIGVPMMEIQLKALLAVVFNGGYASWATLMTLAVADSQKLTMALNNLAVAGWLEEVHHGGMWMLTPFASKLLAPVLGQVRQAQQEEQAA